MFRIYDYKKEWVKSSKTYSLSNLIITKKKWLDKQSNIIELQPQL